jgi:hypothetical protein
MIDRLKVEQCVESLCQNGCAAVHATITAMEHDLNNVPLTGLAQGEREQVLKELKAIMSVYDACDIK